MAATLPYCGLPPLPGELLGRFNLDPVLIVALCALAGLHLVRAERGLARASAAAGWCVAVAAFISPLCALSVSLFSARIGQHMVLVLLAAPLIASGWGPRAGAHRPAALWGSAAGFFLALWLWHMLVPYDATFHSTLLYWSMHVTLFGSAILLWRALLHHGAEQTMQALAAGALTSMQMGLLGAVLAFAAHPMFMAHLTTAPSWGLTPLRDQQLGGMLMWVPGIALFLLVMLRSLDKLWTAVAGASST